MSWRTRLRWLVGAAVALIAGVIALADDPHWLVRLAGAAVFCGLAAALLDAIVFVRSWDVDGRRWWIPSLVSRGRVVVVDDRRVVELRHTYPARLRVNGERGHRDLVLNPLVSVRDLDRWFDEIAG